ncbi:hypothetical protein [Streptodolium elevatio]|uniref:DUF8175 domain-containing protein n=1 Tax=Streptodolium elevatio TaxID=3157996 RepID=A0ABV3D9X0_9ACTN
MALFGRGRDRRQAGGGESPFTERGFVLAAGVVFLIVLAAGFVMLSGPPTPPSEGESASAMPTSVRLGSGQATVSTPPSTAPVARDGSCPALPADDVESPIAQPRDTEWRITLDVPLPYSPTAGPAVVTDSTARCYARTPTGAVFAAVQASWRYRWDEDWGEVAQHLLAPGPGRDAFIRQRTEHTGPNASAAVPGDPEDREFAAGFRVLDYTPDRVRVDVVNRALAGSLGTHTIWTLVWIDGDWKLELPPDAAPPPPTPVREEDAFVAWDLDSGSQTVG